MAATSKWQLSGDYFENCNCDVVCPCLVSPGPPLTARPTQGVCDVALVFHIDKKHLPLSASVKDPTVYPVVEQALGIPVARYALA